MAVYAIGDVQGCWDDLRALLRRLDFDPDRDRLWMVGDLVNRGPNSLAVLRYVKGLGNTAVTVLGNHDLNLLAVAHADRGIRRKDTLGQVLEAPDRDELLDWLRRRPLLHHDAGLGYTMIHAGLPPQWDLAAAQRGAKEVEAVLRGPDFAELLRTMYGNLPNLWSDSLKGWERLRFIINCLTRMRYCDPDGRLDLTHTGPPGTQPSPLLPWFEVPTRASRTLRLVFGHWAALGLRLAPGIHGLDSGCLWGGRLSALRLDARDSDLGARLTQQDCRGALKPDIPVQPRSSSRPAAAG
jgi:bis(5'-nucleosyl)-tetraphosphatase (symmetrical)